MANSLTEKGRLELNETRIATEHGLHVKSLRTLKAEAWGYLERNGIKVKDFKFQISKLKIKN